MTQGVTDITAARGGGQVVVADLDAEAAVISACVLDATGTRLDEVRAILSKAEFWSGPNARIFGTMCTLADAGLGIDIVTIANRLRDDGRLAEIGGTAYLAQIIDGTPYITHVLDHARIVRDKARVRLAITKAHEIASRGKHDLGGSEGTQRFLEEAEAAYADIAHVAAAKQLRPIQEILPEVDAVVRAAHDSGAVTGTPTGFRAVDQKLTGLHDGDVYIVAARPGLGKTSFALSQAVEIARHGYAVAFFSLEMPAEHLVLRMVSAESGINLSSLRSGAVRKDQWPAFAAALATLSKLAIFIDDTAGISVFDVRARLKRLVAEVRSARHPLATQNKVGVAYIDYVQLVAPSRYSPSREQEVSGVSRDLKQTAKQIGVPLVALAQLNREVEKRKGNRPQLSDLRESGSLEADSDTVMFLYREDYYSKEATQERGVAELIIAKQRNGPTGVVSLRFKEECAKFYSLDDHGDEFDDIADPYLGPPDGDV